MQSDYSDRAAKSIFEQETMLSTAPKLSDHTPVSCCFDLSKMGERYTDVNAGRVKLDEKKSRAAQPHKQQLTLSAMFGGGGAKGGSSSVFGSSSSSSSNGGSKKSPFAGMGGGSSSSSAFKSTKVPKQTDKKTSTKPISSLYKGGKGGKGGKKASSKSTTSTKKTNKKKQPSNSSSNNDVNMLVSMGFGEDAAKAALASCSGDVSAATERLLGGGGGGGGGGEKRKAEGDIE